MSILFDILMIKLTHRYLYVSIIILVPQYSISRLQIADQKTLVHILTEITIKI